MHGRIKAGEGTLIGNAGEHYVMAELLKQGVIAALTPRNATAFDILATNGKCDAKIRVKTKSEQYDHWMWNAKKDGEIFRQLSRQRDFVVMVELKNKLERPNFWIVPTHQINKWLNNEYKRWVATPGKKGQQRNVENKQRHLSHKRYAKKLDKLHKDNWQLIWKAI